MKTAVDQTHSRSFKTKADTIRPPPLPAMNGVAGSGSLLPREQWKSIRQGGAENSVGRCFPDERYSVPSEHAGHHVSLRAYADRIVVVAGNEIIAEHKRYFTRNISYFEPWHYVPLLDRKRGALRDGAPFIDWELPKAMAQIKAHYMRDKEGDREFVDLLLLALTHGIDVVETACDLAIEQHALRLSAIINLINQVLEPG